MKLIELSKRSKTNAGKYFAMVDDDMFDYLNQWNWYAHRAGRLRYAVRDVYVETINGIHIYEKIYMHRLVLGLVDKAILCDHKDRDSLNNQKDNLRAATKSQNAINSFKTGIKKTSKYIGVSFNKHKTWNAFITVGQVCKNLGVFKLEEEAARAYDKAAKILHGEFAKLNFKE